ncbi:MAG: hypothetical protein BYD32DRAFT_420781 [Podila humilis]|nr:MAG: hypothetical protein BYD32DRAFT_420781 [Podila humilis]
MRAKRYPVEAVRELNVALAKQRHLTAIRASYFHYYRFRCSFNLRGKIDMRLHMFDDWISRSFSLAISQLTVGFRYPVLSRLMDLGQSLKELNIMIQGHKVLQDLREVIQHCRNRPGQLHLALFERLEDTRGRVLARLDIRRLPDTSIRQRPISRSIDSKKECSGPNLTPRLPMVIEFLQWDCDYVAGPFSDYDIMLFDMATHCDPAVLRSFTMDISSLSHNSLSALARSLQRSRLEHLVVICTDIHPQVRNNIRKVLVSVQSSPLKSVELSGDSVDSWLELWNTSKFSQTGNNPPFGICLQRLEITGTGTAPHQLSHASVLLLHQVISSSPKVELHVESIDLQESRDWVLLIDAIDFS